LLQKKPAKKSQSVLAGAFILTASTIIVKIIGACFKIPIGKILGGVGNSYFEAAYALYNPIDSLAVSGLPIAVSRTVSENVAKKKFSDARLVYKASIPIFLVTGILGFLVMMFGAFYYSKLINSPNAIFATLTLSPTIFFSCLMSVYRGYYQGLRNMVPTAISEVIEALSKLVFGLFFAFAIVFCGMNEYKTHRTVFGKSFSSESLAENAILPFAASGAIGGITIGSIIAFLFLLFYYKKTKDGITKQELKKSPKSKSLKSTIKLLIKLSFPIGLGALIMNVGCLIDTIVVRKQLYNIMEISSKSLLFLYGDNIPQDKIASGQVHEFLSGCFGYVSSIVMLMPGVTQMFGISALPAVTTAWVLKDKEKLKKNVETIIKITSIFSIPTGVGLSIFGGEILNLLYGGARFREVNIASQIIAIMGIAAIFTSMSNPLCSMLQAIGRTDIPVKLLLVGVSLKIFFNYILVGTPQINIKGAGVGTLICYSFVFISSIFFLCKECKFLLNISSLFLKPIIASIVSSFISLNFNEIFLKLTYRNLSIIATLFIFLVVYLAMLFVLGILKARDLSFFKTLGKNNKNLLYKSPPS
jgi:stage V sporulation protein B